MRAHLALSATLLAVLTAATTAASAATPLYTVTPLGTFGHDSSWGQDINDNGQVTGHAYQGRFADLSGDLASYDGFTASAGGGSLLPRFDGHALRPLALNNAGQIVGYGYDVAGSVGTQSLTSQAAVVWTPGQGWVEVGTLGGTRSAAYDINNAGLITGWSRYSATSSNRHAFIGTPGQLTDLGPGTLFSFGFGRAVNDQSNVAGYYAASDGATHAATWIGGVLTDLHLASYDNSYAHDINTGGQVVGYLDRSDANGNYEADAFVTRNGQTVVFGSTAGKEIMLANGINDAGTVVGIAFSGNEIYNLPFVSDGDQLVDLNTRLDPASGNGWNIFYVEAINNHGQIVGTGVFNGIEQAVILTPVPEPATAWLWCLGLLAVGVPLAVRRAPRAVAAG